MHTVSGWHARDSGSEGIRGQGRSTASNPRTTSKAPSLLPLRSSVKAEASLARGWRHCGWQYPLKYIVTSSVELLMAERERERERGSQLSKWRGDYFSHSLGDDFAELPRWLSNYYRLVQKWFFSYSRESGKNNHIISVTSEAIYLPLQMRLFPVE